MCGTLDHGPLTLDAFLTQFDILIMKIFISDSNLWYPFLHAVINTQHTRVTLSVSYTQVYSANQRYQ